MITATCGQYLRQDGRAATTFGQSHFQALYVKQINLLAEKVVQVEGMGGSLSQSRELGVLQVGLFFGLRTIFWRVSLSLDLFSCRSDCIDLGVEVVDDFSACVRREVSHCTC